MGRALNQHQQGHFILLVLVFFILLLSMLFLYLQKLGKRLDHHYEYKQTLMKLYTYNQDYNTILMHSYRDVDNDKASKITKRFDRELETLKSDEPVKQSQEVYEHLEIIEKKYRTKSDLVERFKTLNARIINASYYLDALKSRILDEDPPEALMPIIDDILFTLGQLFIGKVATIEVFEKSLEGLKIYQDNTKAVRYFYRHTTQLTEDIRHLQIVLNQSKALELHGAIYDMHKLLRVEHANNESKENLISIIFFLSSFIVLLVLIYSYLRILKQKEEMHHLAYHDYLTNLPNRLQFEAYIDDLLLQEKRRTELLKPFILLFIDLDRFKVINDTLGHDVGDEIIITIAKRLKEFLGEQSFIARLGGDEFIALLDEPRHVELIEMILEELMVEIRQPILVREYSLNMTTSIGVVRYPEDAEDKQKLLRYADSAMYHAKDKGKDTYAFYNRQLSVDMHRRLQIEQELIHALHNEEFSLVFQPQYALDSGAITGVEALVRWESEWLGVISPEEFISIAEDTGLIIELGYYIFKEACIAYMAWRERGVDVGLIAINISSVQLRQHDAFEAFLKIIKETGIDPHAIEFEITERYIMDYTIEKLTILDRLREIGCQISIDDFGTGYSSMSYLKRLDIDTIKIDKSFILELPNNKHDVEVSKAIIVLSQTLGYKVIAEGVETKEQEELLRAYRCDMGQGYYFSKPLLFDEVIAFYQQHQEAI
jgi:diguanylate cyclase (GGDEF)-like protein